MELVASICLILLTLCMIVLTLAKLAHLSMELKTRNEVTKMMHHLYRLYKDKCDD